MDKKSDHRQFYAGLTPLYHLIHKDWNGSIVHQANKLDSVIREYWGDASSVLDVSCGIGTQSLGLSGLGYRVTASDLSIEEVERAKQEAAIRNLSVKFSVADMRFLWYNNIRSDTRSILCRNPPQYHCFCLAAWPF